MLLMPYIKILRPHQWIKNLFCFVGVFFGGFFTLNYISLSMIAFISFCLASSAVYVLNDLYDAPQDRNHPKKGLRPIASGQISPLNAAILGAFLAIIAIGLSLFGIGYFACSLILMYFIINFLYTLKLKHVVILDVFIISFGFMLRLIIGNSGIGITPSHWVILCTLMLTLFLGFAKRKSELMAIKDKNLTRKVLDDYSPLLLDIFLSITAACSIMCYSLFIILGASYQHIWITVPFVIYGIMYYIHLLISKNSGQDTAKDIFQDKHILITILLFVLSYLFVMFYWK